MKCVTALRFDDLEEEHVNKVYRDIFKGEKYTEHINKNDKIEYWSFEDGTIIFRLLKKDNKYVPFDIMEEKNMKLVEKFEDLIDNGYAELVDGYFIYDEDDDMLECINESIFNYIEDEFIDLSSNSITAGYFFISKKDAKVYEKIKEIENEYLEDDLADEHDYEEKVKNVVSAINLV